MRRLEPCWITECETKRVIDGDTVDVTVTRTLRIRLKDCWAPENGTPEGNKSSSALRKMIECKKLKLKVTTDEDVKSMLTFGRVVGELYVDDGNGNDVNVSEVMVDAGLATETKNG